MSEQTKTGTRLNATQIILIVGIVVIVAAVGVVGFVLKGTPAEPQATPPQTMAQGGPAAGTGNLVVDERNARDVAAEMQQRAKEGMFEVKMNSSWNFPDGKSPSSDAYVANSAANRLPVYFEVKTADGTVVYTSPEIPVGSAVQDIVLTQPLAAGNYECVCTYHLLNEDKTVRSSVSVVVRLHVEA